MTEFIVGVRPDGTRTILVDGREIANSIQGYEVHEMTREMAEIYVFLTPSKDVTLEIEGAIYVVQQPDDQYIFNRAKAMVAALDPTELELAALERMQWGGGQSIVVNVLKAIEEVFEIAISQSEGDQEVHGSADDRHDQSDTPPADG